MPGRLALTVVCGLVLAGSACNQRVAVLETPASPTAPTVAVPPPPAAPRVASVLISPGAVNAGGSLQGTVLLSGPAPDSGVSVSLSASDDSASVEPFVNIPAGGSSGTFTVSTRVVPNDRQVEITASSSNLSASAGFRVFAEAPVFLTYFSEPGDSIGRGEVDHFTQGASRFTATCDRNTLNIQVQAPGPVFWQLLFSGPGSVPLRPGAYEGATSRLLNPASPSLLVSGEGRGCSSTGRFVIHDIDLQNNRVNRFHASFVQRCGNNPGQLSGEIRISNMPPSSSVVDCQR